MKLTVLNDNAPGRNCLSEYGLSYLVEADKKILFDAGATDVYIKNANLLDISLTDIDAIVLSHGHWDHGNGLINISGLPLICHPDAFIKRYNRKDNRYIGLNQSLSEIEERFTLTLSRKPYKISPSITFLGEIPRINNFELSANHFIDENGNDDNVPDDSALAISTTNGLVIVSGCAHAGICNIVEYARKITGIDNVYAVIGGFHLRSDNEQTRKTVEYFQSLSVPTLYPAHCTSLAALTRFNDAFKIHQVLTGDFFYF